jgi:hypothetical protein
MKSKMVRRSRRGKSQGDSNFSFLLKGAGMPKKRSKVPTTRRQQGGFLGLLPMMLMGGLMKGGGKTKKQNRKKTQQRGGFIGGLAKGLAYHGGRGLTRLLTNESIKLLLK